MVFEGGWGGGGVERGVATLMVEPDPDKITISSRDFPQVNYTPSEIPALVDYTRSGNPHPSLGNDNGVVYLLNHPNRSALPPGGNWDGYQRE